MRKLCVLSTLVLIMFYGSRAYGQDFSNKGKDFWVGYGYHQQMLNISPPTGQAGGSQDMVLYFAAEQAANVTVTIPGLGYTQSYFVPANTVITSSPLPKVVPDSRLNTEGMSNKGIHITSDQPIVTYAHVYNQSVSGATILFPTNTLGKEYYSINYKNTSNNNNSNCFFYVVAADTGTTTVKITPSANTVGGWLANNTYTVSMTQGQVYNVMGVLTSNINPFTAVDLTGSKIESVASASGGCKRIAVFSGSGRISITCNNSSSSSDNYMVQAFPKTAWGKKYLTVPAAGNQSFNLYRVCVTDPTTVVKINGAVTALPLQAGFYYEIAQTNQPQLIEADKPIIVVQYFSSQGSCGNGNPGDPEVIYLSPVEQNINKVLWNATSNFSISNHYFNVIIPNNGTAVSSFRLDGAVPPGAFIAHPQDPGYVYLRQSVTAGPHVIQSDSGFNSIAYGFGSVESYGYNAGTNIIDLYQFVSVQNQFGVVNFPAACKSSPFFFSMTFPYQPTQIQWVFGPVLNGFGIADITINSPVFDSTWVVNGKTLYRYKLAAPYTINTPGTYPIKIIAINPTPDGCGNTQEINYNLQVFDAPIADFTFNNVCFPNPVQFTDNSNTGGRPVINRYWNFGDLTTGNTNNPSHTYAAPGPYTVRYSLITDIGCKADTVDHLVTVSPLPTASVAGSIEVCKDAPSPTVTFTGAVGSAPYTFTYNINGGPNLTITTTSGNSVVIPVSTAVPGTFTYNLVSVQDASPALCNQAQTGSVVITVNPLPTASIAGAITVCKNAAPPNITFTGAGATALPYTFTYNINGGASQNITTVSGNSVTVSVPTGTAGTFTYNLLSVRDASTTLCSQTQTGSTTVVVNDLPTASIVGATEVCLNATAPVVIFTGAGTSAPYTFTYNINGGANQTVTTISGNSVSVSVPTAVAGTFVYNLIGVMDASSTLCSQLQTGSASVIVHPLPVPNFSLSTPTCETKVLSFTDLSTPSVGSLTTWAWNFGDGVGTSPSQNPTYTYAAAGNYPVTLSVTNSKGCVSNPVLVRSVTVNPQPATGFILPEVCLSDTYAQFTDTTKIASGSIASWLWNFGDPGSGALNTSTQQHPQHSYSAVGNYTVTLITTSNSGCVTTLSQSFTVNGDIPVSNFNALSPATMCANDSIAIQDAATVNFGSITKVEIYWDNVNFPGVFQTDDFPTPGKIYRHLYPNFQSPATKSFDIRYRAYSGATCINDRIKTIVVNAAPKVQFLDMPNVCLDATPFQITQASEIGGVPGPPGVFSGPGVSSSGVFNPAAVGPGTYMIKYTFTSSAGGCVDTLSKPITVIDSASAQFTYSTLNCEGSPVTFNSTTTTIPAASGTITGWSWDFGDPASGAANTANTQNPSHLFSGWGTYNVRLFVTTSNGCRSTVKTIPVFVNPVPRTNFTFPASSCLPSATVAFNSSSSTIPDGTQNSFTYLWNFGDPGSGALNTSTGSSPSHIYNSVGPFNVTLQITSGAGCVNSRTISVNTIHPEPTGAFTSNKDDLCVGDAFIFTDNSDPADGTIQQHSWNLGDGNIRTSAVVNHTYATAGTYTVTHFIINSHGCRSTTDSKIVTVNPYPIVNAGPDLFILEGGNDTLKPTVTAINPTYLWTPNFYFLSSNTIMNPIVKGVEDFTYTLIVTGRGGCTSEDQVFIKVLKGPEIPNIFSPNGDGIHDKWEIKYLDTYPGGTVEIFNRYGQMIWRSVGYGAPWDGTINGNPVPFGTYYYIVNPKNGRKQMSGYVDVIR